MANGVAFPTFVFEVSVEHEDTPQLKRDCERYFNASTSIEIWMGVKILLNQNGDNSKNWIWIGTAFQHPRGYRSVHQPHLSMLNDIHLVNTPIGIVAQIPLAKIYADAVPPPLSPATSPIDFDVIRLLVFEEYP
jgi:hypothetical protein